MTIKLFSMSTELREKIGLYAEKSPDMDNYVITENYSAFLRKIIEIAKKSKDGSALQLEGLNFVYDRLGFIEENESIGAARVLAYHLKQAAKELDFISDFNLKLSERVDNMDDVLNQVGTRIDQPQPSRSSSPTWPSA